MHHPMIVSFLFGPDGVSSKQKDGLSEQMDMLSIKMDLVSENVDTFLPSSERKQID